MSFPATGSLSMETIRNNLGLGSGEISMSNLYSKKLYNEDGSVYNTPSSGQIDISNFRGKYYTPPAIAPVTVTYKEPLNTFITVSVPSGKTRPPNRFYITLIGGGSGGGGGGGGAHFTLRDNRSGGGGGGGCGGGRLEANITYNSAKTYKIIVAGSSSAGNGGAGVRCSSTCWGDNGDTGGGSYYSYFSINSGQDLDGFMYTGTNLGGTYGGGGSYQNDGGPGGSAGISIANTVVNITTTINTAGNTGDPGGKGVQWSSGGPGGGGGTGGVSTWADSTYGTGGDGGGGGSGDGGTGSRGSDGKQGIVEITWYYES